METITDLYYGIKFLDERIDNYVGTKPGKTELIEKRSMLLTILETKINNIK